jgi:hypothetical protein
MKHLIINADDYGRTAAISNGIRYTHRNGLLSATTTMMNFATAQDDLRIALTECPDLGLGVHLTLTAGSPVLPATQVPTLVNAQGQFLKLNQLGDAYPRVSPTELKAEWRAQIEKFLVSGATLDHLDSHHHSSYFTEMSMGLMLDLANEYGAPIRNPISYTENSQALEPHARRLLADKHTPHPTYFYSNFYDQAATLKTLLNILTTLPEGISEIMCHPGYADEEILRESAYNRQREVEIEVLTNVEARRALAANNITLTTFKRALL